MNELWFQNVYQIYQDSLLQATQYIFCLHFTWFTYNEFHTTIDYV